MDIFRAEGGDFLLGDAFGQKILRRKGRKKQDSKSSIYLLPLVIVVEVAARDVLVEVIVGGHGNTLGTKVLDELALLLCPCL